MNVINKIILLSSLLLVVQSHQALIGSEERDPKKMQLIVSQGLDLKIKKCHALLKNMKIFSHDAEKIAFFQSLEQVQRARSFLDAIKKNAGPMTQEEEMALLQIFVLEQGDVIFEGFENAGDRKQAVKQLLTHLVTLDRFYQSLGGVIGYYTKVLELIDEQAHPKNAEIRFFPPPVRDITGENKEVKQAILDGISALEHMGELYVIGGAGDRLDLQDDATGSALPAARLPFLGATLLHGLIRDLQAREYLFYKLYKKQLTTPILLMTSEEKNNDREVEAILNAANWFSRPKSSFLRVVQPLTPVITADGDFAVSKPLELILKPGGHGVVWKIAEDQGGFDWMKQQGRDFLLVRQINNPLAGVDYGLVAPVGLGVRNKKAFGFASCPRQPEAAEGVNVLSERKTNHNFENTVTNIEYTDFAKHSKCLGAPLPANTNILFADIDAVRSAQKTLPIPGMLVNMKHEVEILRGGKKCRIKGARLESTMQNIADALTDVSATSFAEHGREPNKTFVTLNAREKTISVTKKSFDGKSMLETPPGAFYDLVKENLNLLSLCGMTVATYTLPNQAILFGPAPLFTYNPHLGPLYSIIKQKIRGGSLAKHAELYLDIAEVDLENVNIDGSLHIIAENPLGLKEENGARQFSEACGRCSLQNVSVVNAGIDRFSENIFWKNSIRRNGLLKIVLQGHSEFEAKDCIFSKPQEIIVPAGKRCIAKMKDDGTVGFIFEDVKNGSWHWNYSITENAEIIIGK